MNKYAQNNCLMTRTHTHSHDTRYSFALSPSFFLSHRSLSFNINFLLLVFWFRFYCQFFRYFIDFFGLGFVFCSLSLCKVPITLSTFSDQSIFRFCRLVILWCIQWRAIVQTFAHCFRNWFWKKISLQFKTFYRTQFRIHRHSSYHLNTLVQLVKLFAFQTAVS